MSADITIGAYLAAIVAHTAALNAHTAALGGEKPVAAAAADKPKADAAKASTAKASTAKATTTKTEAPKSKNTRAAMQSILNDVKERDGTAVAKEIISEHAGVAKMGDIPDDKIDAVFDAATAIWEGASAGATTEEEEL